MTDGDDARERGEEAREHGRPTAWTWAVVALCAVHGFFALVLPAWGLTFCMDDWEQLVRLRQTPWPARWLAIAMEHWPPIMWVLLDVKDRLFGAHHDPFVVWSWLSHVVNVALLARLLHARTGSEPASAVAAAAFGVTTHWREVVWWASCASWIPGLTFALLGFIALERHRRGRSIVPAVLATLLAPMAIGAGVVVGPALAVECALLHPRGGRLRPIAAILAGWGAYFVLYAIFRQGGTVNLLPRDGASVLRALRFAADMIGSGMLGGVFLFPMGTPAGSGLAHCALYAVVVGAALAFLGREGRRRVIAAHTFLLLCVALVALTRWSFPPGQATTSRYQYFPVVCWTTLLAFGVAAAWRRSPRVTAALSAVVLLALAVLHVGAARADRQPYAPAIRAGHPALLAHLARAVAAAEGPVYDARLPFPLAQRTTGVAHILWIHAPEVRATYTNAPTRQSVAPFLGDPLLAPLVESR